MLLSKGFHKIILSGENVVGRYQDHQDLAGCMSGPYQDVSQKSIAGIFIIGFHLKRFHQAGDGIHNLIGLSTDDYRSVMLLEPPMTEKPRKLQYFLSADIHTFSVFLHPSSYRQDDYENYALRTRTPFIDEKTWYLYIFTTQKKYQRQGYGKKLIGSIISFAKEKGYSLCLETDLDENVPMYENFGFRVMDSSIYNNSLHHYVMVCKPGDKREEERFDK